MCKEVFWERCVEFYFSILLWARLCFALCSEGWIWHASAAPLHLHRKGTTFHNNNCGRPRTTWSAFCVLMQKHFDCWLRQAREYVMKITNAAGLQRLFFLVEARSKHPNADVFQREDILFSLPCERDFVGWNEKLGYGYDIRILQTQRDA